MLPIRIIFQKKLAPLLLIIPSFSLFSPIAHALPSFARQTGEACTACHIQTWGANLTPRGRDFKLKGYTQSNNETGWKPPLSMTVGGGGSFDLTDYPDFLGGSSRAKDTAFASGSVFYAGKVNKNLGAYVQGTGVYSSSGNAYGYLDKVDLRFASQIDLSGQHIDYGISVNNEPGVQDLWNTNAVWRNSITGGSTLSDRGLSGRVVGASLYTMINNLLYVEAGGYTSLPVDVQQGIGRANYIGTEIDGGAPYWRIALQHNWNGHYMALGHFGLRADVRNNFLPAFFVQDYYTSYSDLGVDATYQYLANPDHIFELKASYVRETRSSSENIFFSNVYNTTIENVNANAAYTWQQTLGLMLGYQYNNMLGHYLATELSYTPFGKQQSLAAPWLNLRLKLGYITEVADSYPQERLYLNGQIAF
ncbi:conserved exported hypothetical protein [Crenothrix polyspora]|uniref:Cytochrome c domain-containing protein n=1 Tax=Crenothrix polyspora TaxID=360316 RepID=A0A1R4HDB3_9GAMM|nr:hypothetical protein [Crenothrix polyspora]SJM94235.1 conserved exported hypothetical protein [Crenothrix polyspora]